MNVHDHKTTVTRLSGDERLPQIVDTGGGARVHLTMAVADYDHMRDLVHGVVRPEGILLTAFTTAVVEEIFFRFIKHREFDVSEMSFAKYVALSSRGDAPMVGIPVFPSRVFRHSGIYVRADRGIRTAKELEGRTVAIPEWAQTAGIYARGMLAEYYRVDLTSIRWVQAGVNEPGRVEKVALELPASICYQSRPDSSISAMLANGEVDAAVSARAPDSFLDGHPEIVRLFPNYRAEELTYFQKTGVFPIMHLIAMRRAVFEQHPWTAMNIVNACEEAKRRCLERIRMIGVAAIPMPWASGFLEDCAATFGADPFPYGLDANRPTLDAFCRFAHDQHITERPMTPDELFPPELRTVARS
ncbi:MAG: 4,5-dihydroxyphthalate decarboxylase [Rhizobiales bacterium]|nr:4,5-dihydroxyphthalate decarboxylase [Hyphomicrobiales bacterium]